MTFSAAGAPIRRKGLSAAAIFAVFVLASSPAFVMGALEAPWRALVLLVVVVAAAYAWERVFARVRGRQMDPGWFMMAWLYVLLLGPDTPIAVAVLGISFAAVFGNHVFGGSGRYVASPAVLGALFVELSYPDARGAGFGAASAWACLVGGAVLIGCGAASARSALGMLIGGGLIGLSIPDVPWDAVAATGSFLFAAAFLVTDPTTSALTPVGRWLHGALAGALAVGINALDPARPDATLFAVLLAGLCVPLIDHGALRFVRHGP